MTQLMGIVRYLLKGSSESNLFQGCAQFVFTLLNRVIFKGVIQLNRASVQLCPTAWSSNLKAQHITISGAPRKKRNFTEWPEASENLWLAH